MADTSRQKFLTAVLTLFTVFAAEAGPLKPAPKFSLRDSAGQTHALDDLPGQPVVVHFWASWCAPCVDELPQWLAAAKSYAGKPVKWVAVSLDENWADAGKIFKDKNPGPNVVSLLDPDQKTSEAFGSFQFPESYLLDAQHRIVTKWVGSQNWTSPAVRAKIDAVLPAK
jgi:cytochrome c biogenesis protein CcmG, thiol:disulfide interchange protein DsbE